MATSKTVSIDRAAEFLQVSRRTIYNYIRRGYLQTTRTIGGQSQRVTLESLAQVQEAARRGERFFVVAALSDKARIHEEIESRHHAIQSRPATSPTDAPTRRMDESLEIRSSVPTAWYAKEAVQAADQPRVANHRLRELSKILRANMRGSR